MFKYLNKQKISMVFWLNNKYHSIYQILIVFDFFGLAKMVLQQQVHQYNQINVIKMRKEGVLRVEYLFVIRTKNNILNDNCFKINRKQEYKIQKMLRENTQRLRSQQSAYLTALPGSSYNWRDQYFPKTDEPIQRWNRQSQCQKQQNNPQQYQSLARMYQQQNQQIQERNNQLLNKVRQFKEKQSILQQQIAKLQAYYRKLLKSTATNLYEEFNNKENQSQQLNKYQQSQVYNYNMTDRFRNNCINTCSSAEEIVLPCRNQKQVHLKDLNDQFCKLVEESIAEKNTAKRRQLRKQLAQLASQMKKVRNNDSEYEIKLGPKVQKTLKGQKSSQNILQTPTNKTLAPYIENNGSNKASIVDKLAYSTHENREKTERTNKKLTHSHSNSNFAGGSASTTGSNFKKF